MDTWGKAETLSKVAAAVLIPIILLVLGNQFASATKEREIQSKFVEIATGILSKDLGSNPTEGTKKLRRWATEIINKYSGVPLPKETADALIQTTPLPVALAKAESMQVSAAKDEERKGFENIVKGDFSAALSNFSNAEELYPGYHNVFEISKALKSALADNKLDEAEKQTLFHNIAGKWAWGVPSDVMQQIKGQISGSAQKPATP